MILDQRHLKLGGKTVISHFTFKPPLVASSELQGHGCFIFPLKTIGDVYRQDGKTFVGAGQGVLIKCGSYVNKWNHLAEGGDSEVVILRLYPEIITSNLDPKMLSALRSRLASRKSTAVVSMDELMKKYLESLFFYFDHPELVDDNIVNLKITELLMLLVRIKEPNEALDVLVNLFDEEEFTLREVVNANLFENLLLDELASLCNMSISTFKRKFKQLTGESPGHYIKNKRLEAAAEFLKESGRSVAEISYDVGFSDPNYFSKSFQAKYGRSPSVYRK